MIISNKLSLVLCLREYDSYRYIATVRYRIDGTVITALRLYRIQELYKYTGLSR
jgi:hypothetical protein